MTSEPNSLATWTPSPRQCEVLERYAIGVRWYTAARELNIPDGSLANWLEVPEFRAWGESLRTEVSRSALPLYGAIIERAQKVQMRVKICEGDGDLDPRDPLVKWSRDILAATLWPVALVRGMAGTIDARAALRLLDTGSV